MGRGADFWWFSCVGGLGYVLGILFVFWSCGFVGGSFLVCFLVLGLGMFVLEVEFCGFSFSFEAINWVFCLCKCFPCVMEPSLSGRIVAW